MIPSTVKREVHVGGVEVQAEFGISLQDSAHIMRILRDTMYSDKILAVLREYGCNAQDAHKMNGMTRPIEVHVPVYGDAELRIRDFGPGLSVEDVVQVYTQYGASTKRDTNDAVGMLGIGSKSAFAYGDTFQVESYHQGKKSTYVAVLDKSDKGIINLVNSVDCGDETGVCIRMRVRNEDINEFQQKAARLFSFFSPQPKINVELNRKPSVAFENAAGKLFSAEGGWNAPKGWTAVMGGVPYKLDLAQLGMGTHGAFTAKLQSFSGELYFDIGEATVSASREELKYSDETKETIVKKLEELVDGFVEKVLKDIENKATTNWQKKIELLKYSSYNSLLPTNLSPEHRTRLSGTTQKATVHGFSTWKKNSLWPVSDIPVAETTRLILLDQPRKQLWRYEFGSNDFVVKVRTDNIAAKDPSGKPVKIDEVATEADLLQIIKDSQIDGIKTAKIDDIKIKPDAEKKAKTVSEKHKLKIFYFNPQNFGSKLSDDWSTISHAPNKDDVYVLIDRFQVVDDPNFLSRYKRDKRVVESVGMTMPLVYAYKVSHKKVVGKKYQDWKKEVAAKIESSKFTRKFMRKFDRYHIFHEVSIHYTLNQVKEKIDVCKKTLGVKHPVTKFVRRFYAYHASIIKNKDKWNEKMEELNTAFGNLFDKAKLPTRVKMREMLASYPILKVIGASGFLAASLENFEEVIKYVNAIDNLSKKENP